MTDPTPVPSKKEKAKAKQPRTWKTWANVSDLTGALVDVGSIHVTRQVMRNRLQVPYHRTIRVMVTEIVNPRKSRAV